MRAGLSPFMVWGSSAKRLLEGETVGNSDPPFEERLEPSGLTRLVALALVVVAPARVCSARPSGPRSARRTGFATP